MSSRISLCHLPDELLLGIAHYLAPTPESPLGTYRNGAFNDLTNLALVCRKLHAASQTPLYENVTIGDRDHRKLLGLLVTLLSRPDLGRLIRSFDITSRSDIYLKPRQEDIQRNLAVYSRRDVEEQSGVIINAWSKGPYREFAGWRAWLVEGIRDAYLGFLLTMLPNLHTLDLNLNRWWHVRLPECSISEPFFSLEEWLCNVPQPNAMIQENLHTVETLRTSFALVEPIVKCFPRLQDLSLFEVTELDKWHQTSFEGRERVLPPWKLRYLHLDVKVLEAGEKERADFIPYIQSLSESLGAQNVERLKFEHSITVDEEDEDGEMIETVDHDFAFSAVHAAFPGAKDIDLCGEYEWDDPFEHPKNSMPDFPNLSRLAVDFEALSGWKIRDGIEEDRQNDALNCVARTLPPQLEELRIQYQGDSTIISWLGRFCESLGRLTGLRKIEVVYESCKDFVDWTDATAVICAEYRGVGVDLTFRNDEDEQEWLETNMDAEDDEEGDEEDEEDEEGEMNCL